MFTRVTLENTVLYIIPIFAETSLWFHTSKKWLK